MIRAQHLIAVTAIGLSLAGAAWLGSSRPLQRQEAPTWLLRWERLHLQLRDRLEATETEIPVLRLAEIRPTLRLRPGFGPDRRHQLELVLREASPEQSPFSELDANESIEALFAAPWDADACRAAITWLEAQPPGKLHDQVLIAAWERWSALEPETALGTAWQRPHHTLGNQLGRIAFRTWAAESPEAAGAWLMQQPASRCKALLSGTWTPLIFHQLLPELIQREQHSGEDYGVNQWLEIFVLSSLENRSPAQAFDLLRRLPVAPAPEVYSTLFMGWSATDPEGSLRAWQGMPEGLAKDRTLQNALGTWVHLDPEAAFAAVASSPLPEWERENLWLLAYSNEALLNPTNALNRYWDQLEGDPAVELWLPTMIEFFPEKQASQLLAQAAPGPLRDAAIQAFIDTHLRLDSLNVTAKFAALGAWIDTIENPTQRLQLTRDVIETGFMSDPEAARAYLRQHPEWLRRLPPEEQEAVHRALQDPSPPRAKEEN